MKLVLTFFSVLFLVNCSSHLNGNKDFDLEMKKFTTSLKEGEDSVYYYGNILANNDEVAYFNFSNAINTDLLELMTFQITEKLLKHENKKLDSIILPIHLWNKAKMVKNKDSLLAITEQMTTYLPGSANYRFRNERYALLICEMLFNKFKQFDESLLLKVIRNLETEKLAHSAITHDILDGYKRTWYRFLLSRTYMLRATYKSIQKEDADSDFKLAANFSEDDNDKASLGSIQVDKSLFETLDTKVEYTEKLLAEKKYDELLDFLTERLFADPSDENMTLAQNMYEKYRSGNFFEYWSDYISQHTKVVDGLILNAYDYSDDHATTYNLSQVNDKWMLLDFWGTWCVPCIAEMPEVNDFSRQNKSQIAVFAMAYRDNENAVRKFMKKHSYTFSAGLADDKLVKKFNIEEFPTKILISPKGHYIRLKNKSTEWQVACKNYMKGYQSN